MEIPSLGLPKRKTLVVLGAGASRGASFVGGNALPPPVDRDFFQILQMSGTGRTRQGRRLLEHVREAYGPSLEVGMETVYSNLEAADTFSAQLKIHPGPTVVRWGRLIEDFNRVVPQLWEETINDEVCDHHVALARGLKAIDSVISLNYDCLIDRALCDHAGSRFSADRGGYGVDVGTGGQDWHGTAPGPVPKGSIELLKLHGSLNWVDAKLPLDLRKSIYKPVAPGVIQAPLANKPVSKEPFNAVWKAARKSVAAAKRLIFIGYSMPVTDGLVRALMATDLPTDLEEVIVVEPDQETRNRHVDFFTRRAAGPRVFAFSSFAELAAMLE